MLRNKIQELHKRLEVEGKVIHFTDEQMSQIHREINEEMRRFRSKLARMEAKSIEDTAKIVLNV